MPVLAILGAMGLDPELEQVIAAIESQERALLERLRKLREAKAALGVVASPKPPEGSGFGVEWKETTPARPKAKAAKPLQLPFNTRRTNVSWSEETERLLRDVDRPLHVKDIVIELGRRGLPVREGRPFRDIISGIVGRKARQQETFKHFGPGIFGLREFASKAPATGSLTASLVDLVREFPGSTQGQIVDALVERNREAADVAKDKRNSRITRLNQLVASGRLRKEEDGSLYVA